VSGPLSFCTTGRSLLDVTDADRANTGGRPSKVAQLIEEYGLEELGAELEHRWTREQDRQGLRALARFVNERAVAAAIEAAGGEAADPANTYRLLTDEEVSPGVRTQVENRLRREGVDVAALREAFVSHGAVRTYLVNHRGATPPSTSDAEQLRRDRERLQRLESRIASVAEDSIERSQAAGRIDVGEFALLVDVDVVCRDCGATYAADELFARGGCDCD